MLDDDFEIASGLAIQPIAERELYEIVADLVPRLPWEHSRIHPDGDAGARVSMSSSVLSDAEARAVMGGIVLGDERGADYAMVTRSAAPHAPLARWSSTRASELVVLPGDSSLEQWYRGRSDPPRAVCAASASFTWRDLVAVQQAGAYIARLPYDAPGGAEAWCHAALNRWRYPPRLSRRVWLVTADNDLFTRRLARYVAPAAAVGLRKRDIACEDPTSDSDDAFCLVVLLTHGRADGTPVVSSSTLAGVLRACARGAIVVHLGCHGAGRLAGDRYGVLAPRMLGVEGSAALDTCSAFAQRCLDAGSPAVIAHLDATWSKTFGRESLPALVEMLVLLAGGAVTAGCAAALLSRAADLRARQAVEHLRANRTVDAGEAWLRYLDLSGFVCLGEVCSHITSE